MSQQANFWQKVSNTAIDWEQVKNLPVDTQRYYLRQATRGQGIQQSLSDIGRFALPIFGVGMGVRGLMGLANLIQRSRKPPEESHDQVVEIPVPTKRADFDPLGMNAANKDQVWWHLGAKFLAGPAALYGGYKLWDYILDARRRGLLDREIAEAKQRYQQALQMEANHGLKMGSASPLSQALEELCEVIDERVKQAGWEQYVGAAGMGMAALAAYAAYQAARERQRKAMLDKAIARRQQHHYSEQPTEILAVPAPMPSRN